MPILTILINIFAKINFKKIIDFLINNWKIISILLIITSLYFYINSLNNKIKNLNDEVIQLKIDNAYCENSKSTLEKALKTQNHEIDKWVKIGKNSKKEFEALKENLNEKKKISEKELNNILQEKTPESCQEAINYLVDSKKDLIWQK